MIKLAKNASSLVYYENFVECMDLCCGYLRDDLNRFPQIKIIKREWPFILNTRVGIAHFKRLTGIDGFESVRIFTGSKTDLVFKLHEKPL
jgi:hypothetical protein